MSLDYRFYDQYDAILNLIDDADGQTASKPMIEDALNLSHGTIYKRVNELVDAGVLEASNTRPVFYSLDDPEAWHDLGKLRLADDLRDEGEEPLDHHAEVVSEDQAVILEGIGDGSLTKREIEQLPYVALDAVQNDLADMVADGRLVKVGNRYQRPVKTADKPVNPQGWNYVARFADGTEQRTHEAYSHAKKVVIFDPTGKQHDWRYQFYASRDEADASVAPCEEWWTNRLGEGTRVETEIVEMVARDQSAKSDEAVDGLDDTDRAILAYLKGRPLHETSLIAYEIGVRRSKVLRHCKRLAARGLLGTHNDGNGKKRGGAHYAWWLTGDYEYQTDYGEARWGNAPQKPAEAASETVAAPVAPEAEEAPVAAPVVASAPVVATMVANVPEEPVAPPKPVLTPLQWIANTEGITRQLFGKPALLFVPFAKGDTTESVNLHARALNQEFQLTLGSGGYWRGFDSVDEAVLVKLKLQGSPDFPYPISLVERPPMTIESIIANAVAEAVKLTKRQAQAEHAEKLAAVTEERDNARIERDAFWNRANAAESALDDVRKLVGEQA